MRKWGLFGICLCVLCGCGDHMGNFHDDSIQIAALFDKIQQQSLRDTWDFALLEERFWDKERIQEAYHLDVTNIQAYVKSSISEAELCEIALWKGDEHNAREIKKAFHYRIETLKDTWSGYIQNAQVLLEKAKIGKIGSYYYMIFGDDQEKVVHYIQKYE